MTMTRSPVWRPSRNGDGVAESGAERDGTRTRDIVPGRRIDNEHAVALRMLRRPDDRDEGNGDASGRVA